MDSRKIALFGIIAIAAFLLGLGMAFSFQLLYLLFFAVLLITLLLMGRVGLEICFLALVFILPFQYFVPANIIAPVNYSLIEQLSRFSAYLQRFFLLSAPLLLMVSIIKKETRLKNKMDPIILVLAAVFVMELVSAVFIGGDGLSAFYGSDAAGQLYSQFWPFLIFIMTYYICSSSKLVKKAISVFMLTAPVVIGLGYLEKALNTIIFTPKAGLLTSEGIRVASTFWDANQLGRYLLIIIMISLPFIIYESKNSIGNISLFFAAVILLIFTRSTSDLLCLFIALSIFVVFGRNLRTPSEVEHKANKTSWPQAPKRAIFIAAAAILVAGVCLMFADYFVFTFNKILSFQTSARFNLDLAGLAMFASSPLYGVGFAHFSKLFGEFNPMLHAFGLGQEMISHNSLVKVASEMGVIGLIPLLFIYYYFAKITLIIGKAIKSDYLRRLQLSLGAIWIAMVVNSWGYWRFFEDPRIWFVAGLALSINNIESENDNVQLRQG
jgi:hypothetical protein